MNNNMTSKERIQLMIHDLIEGHLSTAEIVDKYCEWASSELRNSLIADLEYLKRLYNYKRIIND